MIHYLSRIKRVNRRCEKVIEGRRGIELSRSCRCCLDRVLWDAKRGVGGCVFQPVAPPNSHLTLAIEVYSNSISPINIKFSIRPSSNEFELS